MLKYLSVFDFMAICSLAILIASGRARSRHKRQASRHGNACAGKSPIPRARWCPMPRWRSWYPAEPTHSATTSRSGNYEIGNLAPGKYTVTANAKGFAVFVQNDVDVAAGQVAQFNIALDINVKEEKVNVEAEGPTLDVNPANNASAIVLSGKDLEALPDDPDELLADLQALAGPSAGPNGGQLYIDGFTAGELPPKSSIREIRINPNPFSAEYDKLGYGRIEIFTKPGTDKYHGQFSVEGNSSGIEHTQSFPRRRRRSSRTTP